MLDFILAYWKILLTVYLIGAALTFAATGIFLLWTGKKEDEEREKYPEYYEDMDNIGRWGYCIIVLVVSILVGIMFGDLPILFLNFGICVNKSEQDLRGLIFMQ